MKLKKLAEETSGYTLDDKNELQLDFVTEAETEAIQEALELVTAAAMQSGLRFRKVITDNDNESIVLDASDAEAVVLQSIYTSLNDSEYSYQHGTTEHDQNIVLVSYPKNQEAEKQEIETDE